VDRQASLHFAGVETHSSFDQIGHEVYLLSIRRNDCRLTILFRIQEELLSTPWRVSQQSCLMALIRETHCQDPKVQTPDLECRRVVLSGQEVAIDEAIGEIETLRLDGATWFSLIPYDRHREWFVEPSALPLLVSIDREVFEPSSQDLLRVAREEHHRPQRGLPRICQNLPAEGEASAILPNDGIPCFD
jgi:hypothetical protein